MQEEAIAQWAEVVDEKKKEIEVKQAEVEALKVSISEGQSREAKLEEENNR